MAEDPEHNSPAADSDNDDDEEPAEKNGRSLQKSAMTESYSEILNSPILSPFEDLPAEHSRGSPMRIPSRRPTSLAQGKRKHLNHSYHSSNSFIDSIRFLSTWLCER